MNADFFIAYAPNLHSNLRARQIEFHIQESFLSDEVFFLDPYRRNQKTDSRFAQIGSLTRKK